MEQEQNLENQNQEPGNEGQPAAEPNTPDSGHMIPKSRFDEINAKNKELESELKQFQAESKKATEQRLADQEKWKELAEKRGVELAEAQSKAQKVEAYEETLQQLYDAEVAQIPEDLQALIPEDLSVQQRLNWIAKNKALLLKPAGPDIGAGTRGSGGEGVQIDSTMKKTAQNFGLTDEQVKSAAKRRAEQQNQ